MSGMFFGTQCVFKRYLVLQFHVRQIHVQHFQSTRIRYRWNAATLPLPCQCQTHGAMINGTQQACVRQSMLCAVCGMVHGRRCVAEWGRRRGAAPSWSGDSCYDNSMVIQSPLFMSDALLRRRTVASACGTVYRRTTHDFLEKNTLNALRF